MQFTNEELVGLCEQNDSEEVIRWARHLRFFDAPTRARVLQSAREVVVDGEFYGIPEAGPEELATLDRKPVSLKFRVLDVYKGEALESIEIRVMSDMLAFPGKNTSRYVERLEILESQGARLRPIVEQRKILNASFEAGEISQQSFESEHIRLFRQIEEVERDFMVSDWTVVRSLHREAFYDEGGVIREHERYLIGFPVQLTNNDSYEIQEEDAWIYSGERREDVVAALKAPEEVRPLSPFRGYDPTNEQDCAKVRGMVGSAEPVPAESVAKDLLDRHQVVAYGEFIEFPEATQAELQTLSSKRVRLLFRIHTLYKGEAAEEMELTVNSDMLFVPGDGVSRHAKRAEVLREVRSRTAPLAERRKQFERLYKTGEIEYVAFSEERERLTMLEHQTFRESGLLGDRQVYSLLRDSFYDRSGVINPFQGYLIGVNRKRNSAVGAYHLYELAHQPSRIYWGEEGDSVRRELESLVSKIENGGSSKE